MSVVPEKVWAAAGGLLFLVLLFGVGYGFGRADGLETGAAALDKYKDEVRERERVQFDLLIAVQDQYRELEREHETNVANLRAEYARANTEAQSMDSRVIDDLRSGIKRLRVQVASCSADTNSGSSGPSSGGANGAGAAELTGAASEHLWRIAADGDRAIRKLTALQDWARSAVKLCNVPPKAEGETK